MNAFSKLTRVVDGQPQIVSDPPLIERVPDLAPGREGEALTDALHELLRRYRQTLQTDRRVLLEEFRFVDIARKVVGVGRGNRQFCPTSAARFAETLPAGGT